jgi:hypothetical protein
MITVPKGNYLKVVLDAGICPHGNPVFPERPAARRRRGLRLQAEAEPGESYRACGVYDGTPVGLPPKKAG